MTNTTVPPVGGQVVEMVLCLQPDCLGSSWFCPSLLTWGKLIKFLVSQFLSHSACL